ncbi:SUMO-interacting motif-containing protein 1 isoform X2 [Mixophyes fleayi]|uniref:SUMO-interacting motif-containing protein 1 isoform X2 n=1 Tax=Mixophyes fleayi TaxID=3061075 RepID=UPI003F4DD52B
MAQQEWGMDETIVISDSEDTGDEQAGLPLHTADWRLEGTGSDTSSDQDFIDLTLIDNGVIDLTVSGTLDDTGLSNSPLLQPMRSCFQDVSFQHLITSEFQINDHCLPKGGLSNFKSTWDSRLFNGEIPEYEDESPIGSWISAYSDMRSPKCVSNAMIKQEQSPCKTLNYTTTTSKMNTKDPLENGLASQDWSSEATCTHSNSNPAYETLCSEGKTQSQPVASLTSIQTAVTQADRKEKSDAQAQPLNKAMLYKLRHFKRPPVNHFFFHTLKYEQKLLPKPIPSSRMNFVNSTKEEGFHWGTLHFLTEFVTAQYYPPKDIIGHVIQSILLGAEETAIKHEAYTILMKVQKLHPATLDTVAWDWKLLSEESQTCILFLQYVVQTLDDDFQLSLQRRSLQRCLCKTILSCGSSFSNVKNIIDWLLEFVKLSSEISFGKELDSFSGCDGQRIVFLLQCMLSIAVEVDNLPTTNSNRIADFIFPYMIVLETRQQRDLFLSSTENLLLRAKILELIFHHSCKTPPPPDCSLSLEKILFFIDNFTLLLENQGPEWQRWEEMLQYLTLLFLCLQNIITDHLRSPVIDRIDEILQRPNSQLFLSEEITEEEVKHCLHKFQERVSVGAESPVPLQRRLHMLECMLLTAVKRKT